MAATFIPVDGRLTSLQTLNVPLTGGEVMEIVSPGNAQSGNNYQVTTQVLAAFFLSFPFVMTVTVLAGATNVSPFSVSTTTGVVLFNKTIGSASYALLPAASSMIYTGPILFKDIKGDANTNNITVQFSGGQLCDGLSTVLVDNDYGFVRIAPLPSGSGWYQC